MLESLGKRPQPAATARETGARSCAVDFLRGIAILLVLGCHFAVAPSAAGFLAPVAGLWYRIGWAGVDLFFVLSGFLVSGLLFAEFQRNGRVDARRFLVRRGFKIWPAYFVYLAFIAAWLVWKSGPESVEWAYLWPNLLHVQNYFGTLRVHTWSLAVEEHFYLVGAGAAALFLVRARFDSVRRVFPVLVIASLVTVMLMRHAGYAGGGRDALNLFATHLRFDGLLIGSVAAYLAHFEPERLQWSRRSPVSCLLAGLALAAPTLLLAPDHNVLTAGVGLTVMYIGFTLVILGVIGLEQRGERWRKGLAPIPVRWIARMGFFSYGIYLWHIDLAQVPMKKAGLFVAGLGLPDTLVWLALTSIYVALAFLVGAVMSRLIEIPFLALRDRLFPSKLPPHKPVLPEVPAGERIPAAALAEPRPVIVAGR
jgi:peptidoglycan/LPS O-acetylase OafA/YrhL